MKLLLSLIMTLTVMTSYAQVKIELSDFSGLNNTSWEGNLTYKDYQSGQQRTIDATMQIKLKDNKIITTIQYIYEPNKNNTSSVKIKKNGTYYGNEEVIANTYSNGVRTITTRFEGKDNNKKATMYKTYMFSDNDFKVIKEVQYAQSDERFVRNTYTFKKL